MHYVYLCYEETSGETIIRVRKNKLIISTGFSPSRIQADENVENTSQFSRVTVYLARFKGVTRRVIK